MKKMTKLLGLLVLSISLGFLLFGCDAQTNQTNGDGTFTVTFADYDGTVLKTQICAVGEVCDIQPPAAPSNKKDCHFTHWSVFSTEYDEIDSNTTIKAIYTLNKNVITIGDRSIVWYSVLIMGGIMTAFFLGIREAKRTGVDQDALIDGFLWIVPVAILGARLWYVAFELEAFIVTGNIGATLLKIIGFQDGVINSNFGLAGLAIHGAFFTAVVCAYFFSRKRKINLLKIADLVGVGFLVAQTFGRWGNFLNQEAHGGVVGGMTEGLANWTFEQQYDFLRYTLHLPDFIVNNMYIIGSLSNETQPITAFYHPTFFYELTLNWLGFFIALVLRRMKFVKIGELFSFYLAWYGGVRIFIESMRTDPLTYNLFGLELQAATTTSVLMILGAVALSLCIRLWWKGESYATVPGHFELKKKTPKTMVSSHDQA
jgi:phosphatidylglycerol:prolipoprotein diacylglycerol transferase